MATQPASISGVQQFVESWWNRTPGAKGLSAKGPISFSGILHCISPLTCFLASARSPSGPSLKCKKGQSREVLWKSGGNESVLEDGGVHAGPCPSLQLKSLLMNWAIGYVWSHCCDKIQPVFLLLHLWWTKSISVLPQLIFSTAMVTHWLAIMQPHHYTSQMQWPEELNALLLTQHFFPPQRWDGYNFI